MSNVDRDELVRVAEQLNGFVARHDVPGIHGLLIGFAAGRLVATGTPKNYERELLELCLEQLPDAELPS